MGSEMCIRDRSKIIICAGIMYEYIPYAIEQKSDPTDGKVLAKFLAGKGMKMAQLFGNDSVNCGLSIVELLLSANKASTVSATGFLPAAVAAWGLALLDLIEVGNSCEFAQQAYYDAFLKSSSVQLVLVRTRTKQYYSTNKSVVFN